MGKWRTLFESCLPPVDQRALDEVYEFAPPATEDQLAAAEQALGFRLPSDLREMLGEFNGFRHSTIPGHEYGDILYDSYLNTVEMSVEVPNMINRFNASLPNVADFQKVVFFAQSNGFGDMLGVCVVEVAGHTAGSVVMVDHEVGDLEECAGSLYELLARTG